MAGARGAAARTRAVRAIAAVLARPAPGLLARLQVAGRILTAPRPALISCDPFAALPQGAAVPPAAASGGGGPSRRSSGPGSPPSKHGGAGPVDTAGGTRARRDRVHRSREPRPAADAGEAEAPPGRRPGPGGDGPPAAAGSPAAGRAPDRDPGRSTAVLGRRLAPSPGGPTVPGRDAVAAVPQGGESALDGGSGPDRTPAPAGSASHPAAEVHWTTLFANLVSRVIPAADARTASAPALRAPTPAPNGARSAPGSEPPGVPARAGQPYAPEPGHEASSRSPAGRGADPGRGRARGRDPAGLDLLRPAPAAPGWPPRRRAAAGREDGTPSGAGVAGGREEIEPGDVADIVNEALIEQARRHGVELA